MRGRGHTCNAFPQGVPSVQSVSKPSLCQEAAATLECTGLEPSLARCLGSPRPGLGPSLELLVPFMCTEARPPERPGPRVGKDGSQLYLLGLPAGGPSLHSGFSCTKEEMGPGKASGSGVLSLGWPSLRGP